SLDDNLKTRSSVIFREFDFEIGNTLDLNKLMESIESLYGTNLYEWVYADIIPESGDAEISIHFKEKDWSVMRFGLRFDETNSADGRIAVSRENILGFGNEFTVVGHSGKRKKFIMLESQIDRIYKSLYTFNIKTYRLFRKRQLYQDHSNSLDYEDDRYGTVISLGQQMGKLGNMMFQFKSETLWTHFAPSSNMKNQNKEIRSIIMQSVIDTFDNYPFPKNGNINIIFIESSQEFFGGTEQFVKLFWSGSYAKTYAKKHTLLGGFSLGTADTSTPEIEAFTLGGTPTRLNCYDYDSAMSHFYSDFQGLYHEEKYGNYLAVGKLKYRLFIPRFFHLSMIYNIGNVWNNQDTIHFDSLLQSYGIQGSFASRLGPFNIGWGITSKGDDRLYMSSGWEF
ncbi:BamA/TamA family outer membrane protein, partial [Candidatus Latescibacterota bacterium]